MKLSKRLQCIADFVDQYASGLILADIGTDHGYLPCYLVDKQSIPIAYACDVAKGPLESSKQTIVEMNLQQKVFALLGNGLEPVYKLPIEVITISGMGGILIKDILDAYLGQMQTVEYLILQPNTSIGDVREYLLENGWNIIDENIVEDANHLYEIIVFKRQDCVAQMKMSKNYQFGPILLQEKSEIFVKKWQRELSIKHRILEDLKNTPTHPKYKEVLEEIRIIEEALNEN